MTTETVQAGYVLTDTGEILVQLPDESMEHGFCLADDDQTWDGGLGVAQTWDLLTDDDPRISDDDRERMGFLLEDYR